MEDGRSILDPRSSIFDLQMLLVSLSPCLLVSWADRGLRAYERCASIGGDRQLERPALPAGVSRRAAAAAAGRRRGAAGGQWLDRWHSRLGTGHVPGGQGRRTAQKSWLRRR